LFSHPLGDKHENNFQRTPETASLPFLQDNISLHIGRVIVSDDRKRHSTRNL